MAIAEGFLALDKYPSYNKLEFEDNNEQKIKVDMIEINLFDFVY